MRENDLSYQRARVAIRSENAAGDWRSLSLADFSAPICACTRSSALIHGVLHATGSSSRVGTVTRMIQGGAEPGLLVSLSLRQLPTCYTKTSTRLVLRSFSRPKTSVTQDASFTSWTKHRAGGSLYKVLNYVNPSRHLPSTGCCCTLASAQNPFKAATPLCNYLYMLL